MKNPFRRDEPVTEMDDAVERTNHAVDRIIDSSKSLRKELNGLRFDLDMTMRRVVELTREVRERETR